MMVTEADWMLPLQSRNSNNTVGQILSRGSFVSLLVPVPFPPEVPHGQYSERFPWLCFLLFGTPSTAALSPGESEPSPVLPELLVMTLPQPGQCVQETASPAVTNTAQITARAGTLALTFCLGFAPQGWS